MKNWFAFFIICFFCVMPVFGQDNDVQPIDQPAEGKALVYFIRTGPAYLVNFRVYDFDKPIGKLKNGKYIKYETDPGEHVFWASSENKEFIKANLDANKVYVIQLKAEMGMAYARVQIEGLDPSDFQDQKTFNKAIAFQTLTEQNELDEDAEKIDWEIEQALKKYEKRNDPRYKSMERLEADQNFTHANKPVKVKKKKK